MTPLYGTYAGIVVSAQDPENRGRVRLRIPQILGTALSGWAEAASAGSALPGDQVYVTFEGGDRSVPVYWPRLRQAVPGAWTPLALEVGWTASSLGSPAVHLNPDGVIELAGSVTAPVSISTGVNTKFATLPDGLLPLHRVFQPVATFYRGAFTSKAVMGEYRVTHTTSATSYVTDANGPTVSFVAPGSGQVMVDYGHFSQNSTDAGRALMSVQVTDGSTVITGPDDNKSSELQSANNATVAMSQTVTGLIAGRTYTVVAMYRTDDAANSASFDNKWIKVTPVYPYTAPLARVTIETNGNLSMLYPDGQTSPYDVSLAGVRARKA